MSGNAYESRASASPRFSIIITFHNQRDFINDALDSALAQEPAAQIIAVDDASTDGSQEILKQYGDAIELVCLETNLGACGARNRGAALASGEYLVFLDGDDAFLPWALKIYERIVQAKSPRLILAQTWWFSEKIPELDASTTPKEIEVVEYADYLRRDRTFANSASTLVVSRQTFKDASGWFDGLFPMEDQDFVLRLGTAGKTVQILKPSTILHRSHPNNTVFNIPFCTKGVRHLLRQESLGRYPGGRKRGSERRAMIGTVAMHWSKNSFKQGFYVDAAKLLASSVAMVPSAMIRKLGMMLKTPHPSETLEI